MDLTEIKSGFGQGSNRIVVRGLSKRQKDLLMSGGVISSGIGIGVGLFSLYSISDSDVIPEDGLESLKIVNSVDNSDEGSPEDYSEEIIIYSNKPIARMNQNDGSFNEAFKVARDEVGAGGWFIWKDKVFNTYYKEEWEMLSKDEKNDYVASMQIEENGSNEIQNDAIRVSSNEIIREDELQEKESANTHSEPHVVQANNQTEIDNFDSEISFQAEDIEKIQIELDNGSLEFELQEDAVILEIPIGSNEDIESMIFDATENNLILNEREGDLESIVPIGLKNLASKDISSDDVGLAQQWKNIVEEYPWGEPVIKTEHTVVGLESTVNTESSNESILGNNNKPAELLEFPWGETKAQGSNVSFAHDIQVVNDIESNSVNPVEIDNSAEEYPWGEQVNHVNESNTSPIDDLNVLNDSDIHDNILLDDDIDFDPIK